MMVVLIRLRTFVVEDLDSSHRFASMPRLLPDEAYVHSPRVLHARIDQRCPKPNSTNARLSRSSPSGPGWIATEKLPSERLIIWFCVPRVIGITYGATSCGRIESTNFSVP